MSDSNSIGGTRATPDISAGLFHVWLIAIAVLFLGLESIYILRFPLVMDEYVNSEIVHRLSKGIAYRDVRSAKTVLGLYTQLPVLMSVPDPWRALLAVKFEMALMAIATVLFAAVVLAKDHLRTAVAIALVLLFAMNTFNERVAEFRSDTPTAVFGLIGLVLLLRRRWDAAGLACAVSLMMSQKAAYYVLSSEAALGIAFLLRRDREHFRAAVRFNVALVAGFAAYLAFFSLLAGPRLVLSLTFIGPAPIAFTTIYTDLRQQFWSQTVLRNPVFYALAAAAIAHLVVKAYRRDEGAAMLAAYAIVVTSLCGWHKQPWPYFFVILIPTFFVTHIALLDALRRRWSEKSAVFRAFTAALVVFGAVIPLAARAPATLKRDNGFQRSMFRLGNTLLEDGGTYFAGVPVFYRHKQALGEKFNTLDAYWLNYLWHIQRQEQLDIIKQLDAEPVRFILYNYRLARLPPLFRAYAQSSFVHYWGAVFMYGPVIRPGPFALHIDGDYAVDSRGSNVTIDGRTLPHNARVHLTRGAHHLDAKALIRLRLLPSRSPELDPRYREVQELFPGMYEF
jgi:hypothetical protein